MTNNSRLFLFLLICNDFLHFTVCGRSQVKSIKDCDLNANYPNTFHATIKTVGESQFIDVIVNLTAPFDNTIQINTTIEMLVGTNYQYLFTIKERKGCDAMHKYFGEFWYNLERYAQLIPGMCPIPKGVRRVHNFPMEFEKITTLANFPFGNLRFTVAYYDSTNAIYSCVVCVFEHII